MNEPTVIDAIVSLVPDSDVVWNHSYDDWQYVTPPSNPPGDTEINSELDRLLAEYKRTEYQRLRAPEYPPLTDLADAIFWQQQGDDSKMAAYVAACEAVKAKYPKPA